MFEGEQLKNVEDKAVSETLRNGRNRNIAKKKLKSKLLCNEVALKHRCEKKENSVNAREILINISDTGENSDNLISHNQITNNNCNMQTVECRKRYGNSNAGKRTGNRALPKFQKADHNCNVPRKENEEANSIVSTNKEINNSTWHRLKKTGENNKLQIEKIKENRDNVRKRKRTVKAPLNKSEKIDHNYNLKEGVKKRITKRRSHKSQSAGHKRKVKVLKSEETKYTRNGSGDLISQSNQENNNKGNVQRNGKKEKYEKNFNTLKCARDWKHLGKPVNILRGVGGIRESVLLPDPSLPLGWTRHAVQRKNGITAGNWDVIFACPEGRSYRNRKRLLNYFEQHGEDFPSEVFHFSLSKWRKAAKANSYSADTTATNVTGEGILPSITAVHEEKHNSEDTNLPLPQSGELSMTESLLTATEKPKSKRSVKRKLNEIPSLIPISTPKKRKFLSQSNSCAKSDVPIEQTIRNDYSQVSVQNVENNKSENGTFTNLSEKNGIRVCDISGLQSATESSRCISHHGECTLADPEQNASQNSECFDSNSSLNKLDSLPAFQETNFEHSKQREILQLIPLIFNACVDLHIALNDSRFEEALKCFSQMQSQENICVPNEDQLDRPKDASEDEHKESLEQNIAEQFQDDSFITSLDSSLGAADNNVTDSSIDEMEVDECPPGVDDIIKEICETEEVCPEYVQDIITYLEGGTITKYQHELLEEIENIPPDFTEPVDQSITSKC